VYSSQHEKTYGKSGDTRLLAPSVAGKEFGYTGDYITRLAREGKIRGEKKSGKWFVEYASLEKFVEQVRIEKERRSRELQRERLKEQRQFAQSKPQKTVVADNTSEHVVRETELHRGSFAAVLRTFAVSCAGIVLGLVLHSPSVLTSLPTGQPGQSASVVAAYEQFFSQLAVRLYSFVSPADRVVVSESSRDQSDVKTAASPADSSADTSLPEATYRYDISVFEDSAVTKELFSNGTDAKFNIARTENGVVVPRFTDATGARYMLSITVDKAATNTRMGTSDF